MPSWPDIRQHVPFMSVLNTENWFEETATPPLMSSGTWTTANLAVYCPIYLPKTLRLVTIACFNGAAVSGNIDLGLYVPDSEGKPGAKLVTMGLTAQAGTNVFQASGPWTAYYAKGLMYVAMLMNNTTGAVIRLAALTTNGLGVAMGGIFTEAVGANPLPAVATPSATPVAVNVPILAVGGDNFF